MAHATLLALDPLAVAGPPAPQATAADPRRTRIHRTGDIVLRNCRGGGPIRETPYPMRRVGHGPAIRRHAIRQACFEKRLLRQDGTGQLVVVGAHLSRGGNDGPGVAITTHGEVAVVDSVMTHNLAEDPGR
jgi:hypothetical protein